MVPNQTRVAVARPSRPQAPCGTPTRQAWSAEAAWANSPAPCLAHTRHLGRSATAICGRRLRNRGGLATVLVLMLALVGVPAGCGGDHYHIRPPFDPSIKTIYVAPVRSRTFRRDANLMLWEELIKEVERRTPYKVVGKKELADSTLESEINFTDKNIIVENPFNLPRQLTATLTANVAWYKGDKPIGDPAMNNGLNGMTVTTVFNFFPEAGESSEAAFLRCCQQMAKEVVGAMEEKW
jgi:hypothetical protein